MNQPLHLHLVLLLFFRFNRFVYLTLGGQVGSPIGFFALRSWENFRQIEVTVWSLSGNISLCSAASHSYSCDPIGRCVKTESNNDITLLSRNCWPWLCRLRRALGKTSGRYLLLLMPPLVLFESVWLLAVTLLWREDSLWNCRFALLNSARIALP